MATYKTAALTRPPPAKSSPCAMVAPLPAASPTARRQQRRDDAPCCLRQCAAPHHRAILVPGASSARIAQPVGVVRQSLARILALPRAIPHGHGARSLRQMCSVRVELPTRQTSSEGAATPLPAFDLPKWRIASWPFSFPGSLDLCVSNPNTATCRRYYQLRVSEGQRGAARR